MSPCTWGLFTLSHHATCTPLLLLINKGVLTWVHQRYLSGQPTRSLSVIISLFVSFWVSIFTTDTWRRHEFGFSSSSSPTRFYHVKVTHWDCRDPPHLSTLSSLLHLPTNRCFLPPLPPPLSLPPEPKCSRAWSDLSSLLESVFLLLGTFRGPYPRCDMAISVSLQCLGLITLAAILLQTVAVAVSFMYFNKVLSTVRYAFVFPFIKTDTWSDQPDCHLAG